MNYKDLKRFEEYCRETGTPFIWAELKKWIKNNQKRPQ